MNTLDAGCGEFPWWLRDKPVPKHEPKPGQRIKPVEPPPAKVYPFNGLPYHELMKVAERQHDDLETLRQYINNQPLIGENDG